MKYKIALRESEENDREGRLVRSKPRSLMIAARYPELALAFIGLGAVVTTRGAAWDAWALFLAPLSAFVGTEIALASKIRKATVFASQEFKHIEDVIDHIYSAAGTRFSDPNPVELRIFGLHLGRLWTRLRTVLLQRVGTDRVDPSLRNCHIRMLIVKPGLLSTLNPRWQSSATERIKEIRDFTREYGPALSEQKITIELRSLDTIPMRHAVLLDDQWVYSRNTYLTKDDGGQFRIHASKLTNRLLTKGDPGFSDELESISSWFEYSWSQGKDLLA